MLQAACILSACCKQKITDARAGRRHARRRRAVRAVLVCTCRVIEVDVLQAQAGAPAGVARIARGERCGGGLVHRNAGLQHHLIRLQHLRQRTAQALRCPAPTHSAARLAAHCTEASSTNTSPTVLGGAGGEPLAAAADRVFAAVAPPRRASAASHDTALISSCNSPISPSMRVSCTRWAAHRAIQQVQRCQSCLALPYHFTN